MMVRRVILFALCAAFLFSAQIAFADNPTPRPTRLPTPLPGGGMVPIWMTPPAQGPTQADAGAVLYYYHCMACHGDKGQGLTVEWRAQWDVEHQDCSRSTCHGARHPPEGFTFPKNFAPAIVGSNTLTTYANAQALFDFVSTRMPYQSPGALKSDEYWELVAFLLRSRGVNVGMVDEANARDLALQPSEISWEIWILGSGILMGSTIVGIVSWRRFKR
jgi:cytochrome c